MPPASPPLPPLLTLALGPLLSLATARGHAERIATGLLELLNDLNVQVLRSASYQGPLDLLADETGQGASRTLSPQGGWYKALGARDQARAADFFLESSRIARLYESGDGEPSGRRFLEKLLVEAAWLDLKIGRDRAAFAYGHFRVYPLPGVARIAANGCLSALDAAAGYIRPLFAGLLYGPVALASGAVGDQRGAAAYAHVEDVLLLSGRACPGEEDVHAICRALGRRYLARFWTDTAQRAEFERLSLEPERETLLYDERARLCVAEEFLDLALARQQGQPVNDMSELASRWMSALQDHAPAPLAAALRALKRDPSLEHRQALVALIACPSESAVQIGTGKQLHQPLSLLPGAGWQDNFTEAFAMHVLGKPLPSPLAALLSTLSPPGPT